MDNGSGLNLWVWLVGVVVRKYIDFLILLIPTPLVSVLFCSSILLFVHLKNVFRSCIYQVIDSHGEDAKEVCTKLRSMWMKNIN